MTTTEKTPPRKRYKRLTTRTKDKHAMAVLLPLTVPAVAVEILCQYEETKLDPEAVTELQLLWRTLLEQIVEHAVELKAQPGFYAITFNQDMLDSFRQELGGTRVGAEPGKADSKILLN